MTSIAGDQPITARIADLRPESSHDFTPSQVREIMEGIYARGDRLMVWFLASHMVLAVLLAFYHGTWVATFALGGGAFVAFLACVRFWPRTFFTRTFAGIAQQSFVALHIYQLYGQSEQHFWYFTAFTMMIVYQDWVCMWPGALLIILQHSIFAGLHNTGYPVHFFPEAYVGFNKLFYHFGIALVQVGICGYWAHLLREQTLGDAWRKLQLGRGQELLRDQLTQLRISEVALAESSRRQRAILDNVPDAMWIKDIEGRYIALNEPFCRLIGRPMSQVEGKTVGDLVSPEEAAAAAAHEAAVIEARIPLGVERGVTIGGRELVLDTTVSPVLDSDGEVIGTTGIARDITDFKREEAERRRVEAQMRDAQKLESLGVLAGGIAHDFNNLLHGILGNAELARDEVPAGSPAALSVRQIEESALRAAELTRQMLAYTGKAESDLQRLDVSDIIDDMSDLLRSAVSKKAEVVMDLAPGLPLVEADVLQVRQVVMNLVTNASDALGDGLGTITIRTERAKVSRGQLKALHPKDTIAEGIYSVIEVSDTGHGMSVETQGRIFDPFFTTKFVGRGLGLASVVGILRAHNGSIEFQSEVGRGSRFRAYIPSLTEANGAVPTAAERSAFKGDPERPLILIVDDEPHVRMLVERVVVQAGFRAMTAKDGVDGVDVVRRYPDSVALVVLDMVMPRMNGEEAMAAMREIVPGLPILLSSGYSGDSTTRHLTRSRDVAFIQKPYHNDDLIATIRRLIGVGERRKRLRSGG